MSDFKAEMHQIRFRLGLRPDPAGEANSASPADLRGLLLRKGMEGEGRREGKWKGRRREGDGRRKGGER